MDIVDIRQNAQQLAGTSVWYPLSDLRSGYARENVDRPRVNRRDIASTVESRSLNQKTGRMAAPECLSSGLQGQMDFPGWENPAVDRPSSQTPRLLRVARYFSLRVAMNSVSCFDRRRRAPLFPIDRAGVAMPGTSVSEPVMPQQYAQETLSYFYEVGENDQVYFGQLLGAVSYDRHDRLLQKSSWHRLSDALHLLRFLIDSGDFLLWQSSTQTSGKLLQQPFAGRVNDFRRIAEALLVRGGIDDIDLNTGYWLRKIPVGQSQSSRTVPEDIVDLFMV
jgi:hypothetical protein